MGELARIVYCTQVLEALERQKKNNTRKHATPPEVQIIVKNTLLLHIYTHKVVFILTTKNITGIAITHIMHISIYTSISKSLTQ